MWTHCGTGKRKGFEGLLTTVLRRVMNDNIIGFAHAEVGGAHKIGGSSKAVLQGIGFEQISESLGLLLISFVGGGVGGFCAGKSQQAQKQDTIFHGVMAVSGFVPEGRWFDGKWGLKPGCITGMNKLYVDNYKLPDFFGME